MDLWGKGGKNEEEEEEEEGERWVRGQETRYGRGRGWDLNAQISRGDE